MRKSCLSRTLVRFGKWALVHFSLYSIYCYQTIYNSTDANSVSNFGIKIFPPKQSRYLAFQTKCCSRLVEGFSCKIKTDKPQFQTNRPQYWSKDYSILKKNSSETTRLFSTLQMVYVSEKTIFRFPH